jgi:hypothetical protein
MKDVKAEEASSPPERTHQSTIRDPVHFLSLYPGWKKTRARIREA